MQRLVFLEIYSRPVRSLCTNDFEESTEIERGTHNEKDVDSEGFWKWRTALGVSRDGQSPRIAVMPRKRDAITQ
jgi:hypothetical protein